MKTVTFITGNQNKADYLSRLLNLPIKHHNLDLDEIQSADLKKVAEHKARQAFDSLQSPVLVEDVSLEFTALGGLPGPFVRYFIEQSGLEAMCHMLDGFTDRSATARCVYAYFDGQRLEMFEGSLKGEIPKAPSQSANGFGWDRIFIPEGFGGKIRSELSQKDLDKCYLLIKPIAQVRDFLTSN